MSYFIYGCLAFLFAWLGYQSGKYRAKVRYKNKCEKEFWMHVETLKQRKDKRTAPDEWYKEEDEMFLESLKDMAKGDKEIEGLIDELIWKAKAMYNWS